ncbi:MAG: sodium:solute symporter [Candidatus Latescibacteria bacterium]|nr:sodium:solute symporter [Candidatus Latescibacterota bacterium]
MILSIADWITIAVYFAAVFTIGFYFARKERDTHQYFLAGRNAGWFAVGASIFASNIGSEHFIGLAGSGADSGLAVGAYEMSAVYCILVLAWVFLPYYLKSKVFTMPEYLERRFNPGCRWFLTFISLFAYVFTKISVSLFAGAILIEAVIGWPPLVSAILLVLATGIYTIAGGLSAVIYTDMIQAFILIGGSVVLTVIGMEHVGGFAGLRAALPADFFHMIKPMNHQVYPWTGTIFGVFFLGIWYWCTDQVIVQRALGAKNLTHSRGSALFAAFLKITPIFILVLPGLIARALWSSEIATDPDMAYPLIVTKLMPAGLAGLMIAALLAALMSSLSAVFNSCSTLITMDIYRKVKPDSTEMKLVSVGRWVTAGIVVISIIWIPMIRLLSNQIYQYLQSIQAYIGAPITAVFLTGILWKRATGKAALATLITGGILGLVRFVTDILIKMNITSLGPLNIFTGYAFLNFAVIMFFFCVALMVVLSLYTQEKKSDDIENLTFSSRTMSAGVEKIWIWIHVGLSVLVGTIAFTIWTYFA